MSAKKVFNLMKKSAKTLILSGLLVVALSFLALVVTQKNFKATADLLVVQNQNGFTDYYALSKSAEFLTNVLVESAYTEKFIDEVDNTKIITTQFLPTNKADRLREWEKIVKITRNPNLGMIHVEVFSNDQKQVMEISNAIASVLTSKNFLFLGKGQDLDVRVLNSPIWEKNPSMFNIAMTVAGAFIIGVLISFVFIYYKNEKYLVLKQDDYLVSLDQLQ